MAENMASSTFELSWARSDIEQRLGFSGKRFTQVNGLLSSILGAGATVAFYVCLLPYPDSRFAQMFTQRGITPYPIVFFGMWSFFILLIKWRKLRLQRRALQCSILPDTPNFVLSPKTVDKVLNEIVLTADSPKQFVLFNRILISLSNLRNIGRISDVDDILRRQASQDESMVETSYSLINGFVWAIPVLGFIGTVLGLSQAIGSFGGVLSDAGSIEQLTPALRQVTAGLATAFETTLIALVAALAIQLALTAMKKAEEEFLDSCSEYCTVHIVGRLRMSGLENDETEEDA